MKGRPRRGLRRSRLILCSHRRQGSRTAQWWLKSGRLLDGWQAMSSPRWLGLGSLRPGAGALLFSQGRLGKEWRLSAQWRQGPKRAQWQRFPSRPLARRWKRLNFPRRERHESLAFVQSQRGRKCILPLVESRLEKEKHFLLLPLCSFACILHPSVWGMAKAAVQRSLFGEATPRSLSVSDFFCLQG